MTAEDLRNISSEIAPTLSSKKPAMVISDIVIAYFIPGAGLVMFILLIAGGFQIMFSGGDPKAVEAGKGKVTSAIIGFIVIFAAYWIVQAIAIAFGLKAIEEIF